MSNRLIKMVHQVKGIKGPARAVLLVLADEARDYNGGRSSLTTQEIADRTGLSRRTVHRAYGDLIAAGHITREPTKPGDKVHTAVHPCLEQVAAPARVADGSANVSAPVCQSVRGSYSIKDIDQDNPSPTPGRAREPAAVDEVDQVFAAWDAFHQRAGLLPVTRGMARRGAVAAKIAEAGLGATLMVVDRTERARRDRRAPKGQGDMFFGFDIVFGVGKAAALNLFDRMLDGEFGVAEAAVEPVAADEAVESQPGEGPAEAQIRAAAMQQLGRATYQAWLAPARLAVGPDGLTITAASAFAADHISNQIAPQLRRHGMAVRVTRVRIGV